MFIVLIPVLGTFMILSSALKFKRLFNPVSIIVLWWCFWLWLANFSLTGFFVPGGKTQLMILIMLAAVFLGSKLAFGKDRDPGLVAKENEQFTQNGRYLLWLNILFFPVAAFFFLRALPLLLSGSPVKYRSAVFGSLDQPSPVFGGGYFQFLFQLIVSPVIFFSLIAGIILFFRDRRKMLLLVSGGLVVLEAVMTLGRFNFYYILAFVVLTYVFIAQRHKAGPALQEESGKKPFVRMKKLKILTLAGIMLAGLLFMSIFRGEKNAGPVATLGRVAVNYHTVGLVLFDQELESPSSRLNSRLSCGRSIIGGIDTIVVILLRRFNSDLTPIAGESGRYMDEPRQVGEDEQGGPIFGNAFYTILYSLYFDGRYLAVLLVSLIFGYGVSASYLKWLKQGSLPGLAMVILLMYAGVFSLFQSPAEGLKFWIALLLVAAMKRFSLANLRTKYEPEE